MNVKELIEKLKEYPEEMRNCFIDRVNDEPGWVMLSNGHLIDAKTLEPEEIIDIEGFGKVTAKSCWDKGGKKEVKDE